MTLDPPDAKRIQDLILHAQRIQVVSHVAPDGDAIGSLLGLGWLLRAQGKEPSLTCEDPVPDIYRWLPGCESGDNRKGDGISKGYRMKDHKVVRRLRDVNARAIFAFGLVCIVVSVLLLAMLRLH